MKILIYDTETTGLLVNQFPLNHEDQPWPVQIAAAIFSADAVLQSAINLIINPPCLIPPKLTQLHGISNDRALEWGLKPITAVSMFLSMLDKCDTCVAHNGEYDMDIITSAQERTLPGRGNLFQGKKIVCTKEAATPVLNLPPTQRMMETGFGNKPKAPSLAETYRFLFGEDFTGAHGAFADMMACAKCYFELVKRGAIT